VRRGTVKSSHGQAARRGVAISSILAVLLVLVVTPSASADDQNITFTPATQSVHYGDYWNVQGAVPVGTWCAAVPCTNVTMTFTSGSITRTFPNIGIYNQQFNFGNSDLMPLTDLGVGTHSFNLSFTDDSGTVTSATPAKITITPAALLSSTTIVEDPNNTANAIVTAQLSGSFIDELPTCYCEDQGLYSLPAGTWNTTVTNSSDTVVLKKQQQQASGGNPFFVTYWPDVPAGESFSADSTFTVAAAASSNYALSDHKFSWTTAKSTGSGDLNTGAGSKPVKAVVKTGFQPPTWLLLLVLLVSLLLVALDIVLLVRRRRVPRSAHVTAEPAQ
jgi:hypothetical protein